MPYADPEVQKAYQQGYQSDYQRERYARRMAELKDLLGNACAICGTDERLEFDHLDPNTKSFSIARRWNAPLRELKEELAKCQLLCHDHHLDKTLSLIHI